MLIVIAWVVAIAAAIIIGQICTERFMLAGEDPVFMDEHNPGHKVAARRVRRRRNAQLAVTMLIIVLQLAFFYAMLGMAQRDQYLAWIGELLLLGMFAIYTVRNPFRSPIEDYYRSVVGATIVGMVVLMTLQAFKLLDIAAVFGLPV